MNLRVGVHRLNESLSLQLFFELERWQKEIFDKEIDYEDCQNLLDEYDYVIDYVHINNKEFECNETFFVATVVNAETKAKKFKDLPYYSFQLGLLNYNEPSEDDVCFRKIIDTDLRHNH